MLAVQAPPVVAAARGWHVADALDLPTGAEADLPAMNCEEPGCGQELADLEALIVHSSTHYKDALRDAVVVEFFHPEVSEPGACQLRWFPACGW